VPTMASPTPAPAGEGGNPPPTSPGTQNPTAAQQPGGGSVETVRVVSGTATVVVGGTTSVVVGTATVVQGKSTTLGGITSVVGGTTSTVGGTTITLAARANGGGSAGATSAVQGGPGGSGGPSIAVMVGAAVGGVVGLAAVVCIVCFFSPPRWEEEKTVGRGEDGGRRRRHIGFREQNPPRCERAVNADTSRIGVGI